MKKNKSNTIFIFFIILFPLLMFFSCIITEPKRFHVEVSLENYPDIENYALNEEVMYLFCGVELNMTTGFFTIRKINEQELYGRGSYIGSTSLFLVIKEGDIFQKMRQSKSKIFFNVDNSYHTTASWNGDETITIIQDDIKFFEKSFWDWYLLGTLKVNITNIDASLPFSPTFRMLLSDNNNVDNTSVQVLNCSNGQLNFYDYIKVGEDYESAQYYIKIEEYNSTSEQYELTRISKEKIISIVDGDPNEYKTLVDWNSGSPIINKDDFKLFDDTAWNVVE